MLFRAPKHDFTFQCFESSLIVQQEYRTLKECNLCHSVNTPAMQWQTRSKEHVKPIIPTISTIKYVKEMLPTLAFCIFPFPTSSTSTYQGSRFRTPVGACVAFHRNGVSWEKADRMISSCHFRQTRHS